ncbi:intermembrane lipid transfer protein VPS13D-like, partial [Mercenaria mercenaria]|uniref:intermembrane lipid transfer protein VPS13D-like n=1 Tax=Mercenaria mercenaria TaxID=6596 RepID=UPI00234E720A
PDVLNVNVTSTLLELYNLTKDKWTEDYYKHKDGSQKEAYSPSDVKRRQLFIPYAVRNHTGSPVWFAPVTVNPDTQRYSEKRFSESEMTCVPPNQEGTFSFHRKEKIRHKKSSSLVVNQLIVKVDGWQRLHPVSVDKVGVYFRDTLPDVSKPSIIKVNDQQKARVVFDIQQEGSARKVITLRSALIVSNRLDAPIELKLDNPIIPGRYDFITVNSSQQKSIPMPFVLSRLWVRPSDWPVEHSNQAINWQHVVKPGEVNETLRECRMPDSDAVFRYCVAVRRENFPEDHFQSGVLPLPGHTVVIMPPVTVVNLLPIDLHYYFKGTVIAGDVKPGKKSQIPAADLSSHLELGICLENFQICRELWIPSGTRSYKVKLRLIDSEERLLEIYLGILSKLGGSLKLIVSAPYWIVNRSGLPLVFRQDGSSQEAAGQFEENEMARIVSPFLFSFTDKDSPYLCEMRVGKHKHGPNTIPMWSSSFSLEKEANVRQLHVAPKDGNRPDWLVSARFKARKRFFLPSKCV